MLGKFKKAVNSVMNNVSQSEQPPKIDLPIEKSELKFPYNRPEFLALNPEEVEVSADHTIRPILVPRDVSKIPWNSGYAETINGGKTKYNEDQCRAEKFILRGSDFNSNTSDLSLPTREQYECITTDGIPFYYFGVFDGHAGTGASLMAVNMLHNFIQQRLKDVSKLLIEKKSMLSSTSKTELNDNNGNNSTINGGPDEESSLKTGFIIRQGGPKRITTITKDELIIGALESAFADMDAVIAQESAKYKITGGCAALVALFLLGKLYVANAGDCRAVLMRGDEAVQLTTDFTPETDRQRIQFMAKCHPHLLHNEFTRYEFVHRVLKKDVDKQVLYRDAHMKGWAYKTVENDDIKIPLIYGEGKKARLLATIGVTRGFGDHDLRVPDTNIMVKPFLTSQPQVVVYDVSSYVHTHDDVLVLGSDGLWDVIPNRRALDITRKGLNILKPDDHMRYTSVAQDLVVTARGLLRKSWRTVDDLPASYDDISCFVIPLSPFYSQHVNPELPSPSS